MLTELQQSLQTKYPHITFNHEEYSAILPAAKHTEALQEELFSVGYFLSIGGGEGHFVYRWLSSHVEDKEYPLLQCFLKMRKDKRENVLKVLAFVFFFACQCGTKHTNIISLSQDYIAEKSGLHRNTVSSAIKAITDLNLLRRINTGTPYSHKASVYFVDQEIFVIAAKSGCLCHKNLREISKSFVNGGLLLSPTFSDKGSYSGTPIHIYGVDRNECTVVTDALFPNTEGDGCLVHWHEDCYNAQLSKGEEVGNTPENNSENEELEILCIKSPKECSLTLLMHNFEDATTGSKTAAASRSTTTPQNPSNRGKVVFSCVSVYEHSLDFSNIVIGPKTRFPELPFESSA